MEQIKDKWMENKILQQKRDFMLNKLSEIFDKLILRI